MQTTLVVFARRRRGRGPSLRAAAQLSGGGVPGRERSSGNSRAVSRPTAPDGGAGVRYLTSPWRAGNFTFRSSAQSGAGRGLIALVRIGSIHHLGWPAGWGRNLKWRATAGPASYRRRGWQWGWLL